MFDTTQSFGAASDFEPTGVLTTLSMESSASDECSSQATGASLGPSVLSDLQRFAVEPAAAELLAVLAASVRHGTRLSLVLEMDDRPLKLTLHPQRQVYFCDLDLCALGDKALSGIRLVSVQPDTDAATPMEEPLHRGSLRPLLWHLAMRGAHVELLPEITGPVRCRVTLGFSLSGLPANGATRRLIQRMKDTPVSVDDLLGETVLGRIAIQRLWNALYLQSALMVSRAFPH